MAAFVIEVFSTRADVTREEFLAHDETVQEWSYTGRPGLLRRTLATGEPGQWLVLTVWTSRTAANVPAPDGPSLEEMIDPTTYRRAIFKSAR